jgi:hypothetical protein
LGFKFFTLETLSGFLREVGFAATIALAISVTIERISRERELKNLAESRNLIAQDVFKAVIGSFVPKDIRDITFDSILLVPVIRDSMRLELHLTYLPQKYSSYLN